MWLPNDTIPPHAISTVDVPEIRASVERVVKAHLELCQECREWSEAHGDPDYERWLLKRYMT